MKTRLTAISFSVVLSSGLHAQNFEWKWVNGSNAINPSGTYGTKGTAGSTNEPGGRYYGNTWRDASGNFWLFGGAAYDASGNSGFLNDLWEYNPSTNVYTWITGSSAVNAAGVYGTKGTAAAANTPGARYASASVADGNGNLWLFGGGYGTSTTSVNDLYNDLWKYNIASGEWTWVSGSSSDNQGGVYGTLGVAATTNSPGSRFAPVAWIDASNNIWIFGGVGYDGNGNSRFLNDLWRYSPSTGLWTWMSGNSTGNQSSTYGTKGVATAANIPGGRYASVGAMDNSGNFWLFGGGSGPSTATINAFWNDLWEYTPSTGLWTWVSGTNTANVDGVYGTQGTGATGNYPGGRLGTLIWNTESNGNLWLLGGEGYGANAEGDLDDFWSYNIATNVWTWISGDQTPSNDGNYGTMGTPAASDKPGSRYSGAVTWTDAFSNLWLFGGKGLAASGTTLGYMNDLWEYLPITVLAVNWLDFTGTPSGNHTFLQWQTTEEQNNWSFTVQRSADGQNYQSIGTVPGAGSSIAVNTYSFTDDQPSMGLNYYRLELNETGGQAQYSKVVTVNFGTAQNQTLSWYATGKGAVQATLSNGSNEVFRLFDMGGKLLRQGSLQNGQMNFSGLVPGLYVLQVNATAGLLVEKIAVL